MNVPKLRFKEFNDEWQNKQLSELALIIDGDRGKNYPKEAEFFDEEYCLFLNAGNVTKFGFDFSNNQFITKEKDELLRNGKLARGDLILTTRGTVGNVVYYDQTIPYDNVRINSGMVIIRNNDYIKTKYLYSFMKSPKFELQVARTNFGSAQPQLTIKGLAKFSISYSSEKEQTKIANFLSLLDKKIELQTKKIEDLKLFTKKTANDLIDKYTTNSEERFVEDICNIQTGKSNTQDRNENGQYPFYIRSEEITYSDKYIFDCEAVLTIGDGNIGKVYFYENGKFDCHQRVYVMNNFNSSILGKYFYYYFSNNFYKRAMSMSAKNTVDSVRLEMISKMKIRIPEVKEQQKIINILTILDNKVILENKKLKSLIELKKGLMQSMFV